MSQMATASYIGHVSPEVFGEMDYIEAAELVNRLVKMKNDEDEMKFKFFSEMVKAIVKSNGARVF